MERVKESVTYDGDLPLSHEKVVPYVGEEKSESKSLRRLHFVDVPKYTAGGGLVGMGTGEALYRGLEQIGVAEQVPEAAVFPPLIALGGAAGLSYLAKKNGNIFEKRSRIKADNVEQTSEDLSERFEEEDLVVVRDYLTGTGEAFERTAETAIGMYHETLNQDTTQYFEEFRSFKDTDYQISHFIDGELAREFFIGLDQLTETDIEGISGAVNTEEWA